MSIAIVPDAVKLPGSVAHRCTAPSAPQPFQCLPGCKQVESSCYPERLSLFADCCRQPAENGGPGFKYTIPRSTLANLRTFTKDLTPREVYDAVMAASGLFEVEPAPSPSQ